MDTISPEHRSWNMSRIRSTDTAPEQSVRAWLFSHGFRYRKNDKRLPGKPDIVLPKYKTVIFVHVCFWHRHPGCSRATTPGSNTDFWQKKFCRNVERDKEHVHELERLEWNVIVIWECELKKQVFEETMLRVQRELQERDKQVKHLSE